MEYDVVLEHCPDGSYFGYSEEYSNVMATGTRREKVLGELRTQILYQVEYCPCSFVQVDRMKLNVTEREGLCENTQV